VDWTFSDAFTLVTGLRYTDEKVAFRGGTSAFVYTAPTPMMPNPNMLNTTGEVFRFLDGGGMADFPFTTTDNEFKDDNISFRVALEYRPDDDMMFYASVSSAFKSGGFFGDFTTEQGELEPFNSETILAYEGGVKLTTADGRVQMNGSVFYYDYEDIQTVVPAPFGFKLDNVEEAEVIGIDLDITARPVEGLDLILGMGWLNTETTSSMFPTLDKNKLPNAPELQVNGLVRYEIPLVDQFRLAVQGNFKYSDNKFTEATNTGLNFAADYIVFNGSLTLIPDSGEWDLTVWGKNLGDEEYFEEVFYSDVVFTVFNFPAPPRTFGATFNYRF
ncbi:MAG: TonB-dependent receptor domain-containing protein, partial [Gammaproteobacteria bacterium]